MVFTKELLAHLFEIYKFASFVILNDNESGYSVTKEFPKRESKEIDQTSQGMSVER